MFHQDVIAGAKKAYKKSALSLTGGFDLGDLKTRGSPRVQAVNLQV